VNEEMNRDMAGEADAMNQGVYSRHEVIHI